MHRQSLNDVFTGRISPAVLALPLRLVEPLRAVELVVALAGGAGLLGPGEGLRALLAAGWLTLAALAFALLTCSARKFQVPGMKALCMGQGRGLQGSVCLQCMWPTGLKAYVPSLQKSQTSGRGICSPDKASSQEQ